MPRPIFPFEPDRIAPEPMPMARGFAPMGAAPSAAPTTGGIFGAAGRQGKGGQKGPSFFGEGGVGRNIAGMIGDVLMQYGGLQPAFAPAMQQRQQFQRQQELATANRDAERRAKLEDWVFQQQYEAAHPKPVNNDTVSDFDFIASKIGPEAANQYLRNIAAGPPMMVENPDGTKTLYPRGALGGGPAAPTAPQTTLPPGYKKRPRTGGPTPGASGTFP